MNYYSDRELGPKARIHHEITPVVWAGIVGLVQALLDTGGFGAKFPERCLDGQVACGSNEAALAAVLAAEMPGLAWPLETSSSPDGTSWSREPYAPPTLLVLDFLEFVWANVGKPVKVEYHNYQRHHHLRFDIEEGQADFCDDVNRLFSRNGVAYELTAVGQIRRILPETLGDMIARSRFETGDQLLDGLLEESRAKFSDPDPLIRREGLERLWDGWERLKTLMDDDKKKSVAMILDAAAKAEPDFRQLLEDEAKALTSVGNTKLIRHYEKTQKPVFDTDHVDYLYFRLFALITLLIRKNAPSYQAR